jgi:Fe-S cluster assembly protein SufD
LRSRASDYFRQHGLPHPKQEAWRFTKLRAVSEVPFTAAHPAAGSDLSWARSIGAVESAQISLLNGHPVGLDVAGPDTEACTISELLRRAPERLEPHLGRLAREKDGFSALNEAMFQDGVRLGIGPGEKSVPIQVLIASEAQSEALVSYPRLLVVAEPNSRCTLVEIHVSQGQSARLANAVTEIVIGQNASLEHIRVVYGAPRAHTIQLISVEQAADSRYTSRVITLGGALSRLDLEVMLAGPGAECALDGLYLAGAGEQVDHHTRIAHRAPHCQSNEKYKGIVYDDGSAVFDGLIHVERAALDTSAHQENRNLVLSDAAVVNTKPNLEIDADAVRCTHAATVGQLNPDDVFYLQTRAIDEPSARAILAYAFAREMLDRVSDESLRATLSQAVLARLGHRELFEELA